MPIKVFKDIEKVILILNPGDRYNIPWLAKCKVLLDHYIRFKKSLYSVPSEYIGKKAVYVNLNIPHYFS